MCSQAAWKYFKQQRYGRIVNTCSPAGIYGNYGQANYSAAKAGIHGMSLTLSIEGKKYNIKVNTIAPLAATRMTKDLMPKQVLDAIRPEFIVPFVGVLAHERCPSSGGLFELAGGLITKVRVQRSKGWMFGKNHTSAQILEKWDKVVDFSEFNYPENTQSLVQQLFKEL